MSEHEYRGHDYGLPSPADLERMARPHMGTRDPMPIPALEALLGPDRPASVTRLEAIMNGPHPLTDESRALIAEYSQE